MTDEAQGLAGMMRAQAYGARDRERGEKPRDPLDRHLLVAVGDAAKLEGVGVADALFADKSHVRLTLMNILAAQPAVWAEERDYESLQTMELRHETHKRKGMAVLEKARKHCLEAGFGEDMIELKVAEPQVGKAHDIIREARSGLFDAVVLSHRGQVEIEKLLDKSLCRELLEDLSRHISFPIWLCRRLAPDRRGVLLCVDGSDPSMRMADHVGFMMAIADQPVTVFHAYDPASDSELEAQSVVDDTVRVLAEAGLPVDRIETRLVRGTNPARLILEEMEGGGHVAVAMGSAGANRGFFQKIFVGSVARKVFAGLEGAALWVCF